MTDGIGLALRLGQIFRDCGISAEDWKLQKLQADIFSALLDEEEVQHQHMQHGGGGFDDSVLPAAATSSFRARPFSSPVSRANSMAAAGGARGGRQQQRRSIATSEMEDLAGSSGWFDAAGATDESDQQQAGVKLSADDVMVMRRSPSVGSPRSNPSFASSPSGSPMAGKRSPQQQQQQQTSPLHALPDSTLSPDGVETHNLLLRNLLHQQARKFQQERAQLVRENAFLRNQAVAIANRVVRPGETALSMIMTSASSGAFGHHNATTSTNSSAEFVNNKTATANNNTNNNDDPIESAADAVVSSEALVKEVERHREASSEFRRKLGSEARRRTHEVGELARRLAEMQRTRATEMGDLKRSITELTRELDKTRGREQNLSRENARLRDELDAALADVAKHKVVATALESQLARARSDIDSLVDGSNKQLTLHQEQIITLKRDARAAARSLELKCNELARRNLDMARRLENAEQTNSTMMTRARDQLRRGTMMMMRTASGAVGGGDTAAATSDDVDALDGADHRRGGRSGAALRGGGANMLNAVGDPSSALYDPVTASKLTNLEKTLNTKQQELDEAREKLISLEMELQAAKDDTTQEMLLNDTQRQLQFERERMQKAMVDMARTEAELRDALNKTLGAGASNNELYDDSAERAKVAKLKQQKQHRELQQQLIAGVSASSGQSSANVPASPVLSSSQQPQQQQQAAPSVSFVNADATSTTGGNDATSPAGGKRRRGVAVVAPGESATSPTSVATNKKSSSYDDEAEQGSKNPQLQPDDYSPAGIINYITNFLHRSTAMQTDPVKFAGGGGSKPLGSRRGGAAAARSESPGPSSGGRPKSGGSSGKPKQQQQQQPQLPSEVEVLQRVHQQQQLQQQSQQLQSAAEQNKQTEERLARQAEELKRQQAKLESERAALALERKKLGLEQHAAETMKKSASTASLNNDQDQHQPLQQLSSTMRPESSTTTAVAGVVNRASKSAQTDNVPVEQRPTQQQSEQEDTTTRTTTAERERQLDLREQELEELKRTLSKRRPSSADATVQTVAAGTDNQEKQEQQQEVRTPPLSPKPKRSGSAGPSRQQRISSAGSSRRSSATDEHQHQHQLQRATIDRGSSPIDEALLRVNEHEAKPNRPASAASSLDWTNNNDAVQQDTQRKMFMAASSDDFACQVDEAELGIMSRAALRRSEALRHSSLQSYHQPQQQQSPQRFYFVDDHHQQHHERGVEWAPIQAVEAQLEVRGETMTTMQFAETLGGSGGASPFGAATPNLERMPRGAQNSNIAQAHNCNNNSLQRFRPPQFDVAIPERGPKPFVVLETATADVVQSVAKGDVDNPWAGVAEVSHLLQQQHQRYRSPPVRRSDSQQHSRPPTSNGSSNYDAQTQAGSRGGSALTRSLLNVAREMHNSATRQHHQQNNSAVHPVQHQFGGILADVTPETRQEFDEGTDRWLPTGAAAATSHVIRRSTTTVTATSPQQQQQLNPELVVVSSSKQQQQQNAQSPGLFWTAMETKQAKHQVPHNPREQQQQSSSSATPQKSKQQPPPTHTPSHSVLAVQSWDVATNGTNPQQQIQSHESSGLRGTRQLSPVRIRQLGGARSNTPTRQTSPGRWHFSTQQQQQQQRKQSPSPGRHATPTNSRLVEQQEEEQHEDRARLFTPDANRELMMTSGSSTMGGFVAFSSNSNDQQQQQDSSSMMMLSSNSINATSSGLPRRGVDPGDVSGVLSSPGGAVGSAASSVKNLLRRRSVAMVKQTFGPAPFHDNVDSRETLRLTAIAAATRPLSRKDLHALATVEKAARNKVVAQFLSTYDPSVFGRPGSSSSSSPATNKK